MKEKTIKLFATQIPYTEEELEENEVYVEFSVGELLDQIESSDVYNYAIRNLGLVDEFSNSLYAFAEDEMIEELESRGHNFSYQIGEGECIEFLQDSGYIVSHYYDEPNYGLDCVDAQRLEDIQKKFIDYSWDDRLIMYNKIFNL
jgi:hypothetical protein